MSSVKRLIAGGVLRRAQLKILDSLIPMFLSSYVSKRVLANVFVAERVRAHGNLLNDRGKWTRRIERAFSAIKYLACEIELEICILINCSPGCSVTVYQFNMHGFLNFVAMKKKDK